MTNVVLVGEFLWWMGGGGKPNLVISDELINKNNPIGCGTAPGNLVIILNG